MVFKGGITKSRDDKATGKPFISSNRPVPGFSNYIILNYRVSHEGWIGGPIDDSKLPSKTQVDYVRVYSKQ